LASKDETDSFLLSDISKVILVEIFGGKIFRSVWTGNAVGISAAWSVGDDAIPITRCLISYLFTGWIHTNSHFSMVWFDRC